MALPDLGDEGSIRCRGLEFTTEHRPVDFSVQNLESLTVHPRGVTEMEVSDVRSYGGNELAERPVVVS
jgi:hypothetical protein